MSGHHIRWTFRDEQVEGKVICDEPRGADCRLGPESYEACQCESWNILRDDDSAPYHFPDGGDRSVGDRHYMVDVGECQVVAFLSEGWPLIGESCADSNVEFEVGRTQIEPVWTDDGCEWKQAAS